MTHQRRPLNHKSPRGTNGTATRERVTVTLSSSVSIDSDATHTQDKDVQLTLDVTRGNNPESEIYMQVAMDGTLDTEIWEIWDSLF